MKLTRFVYNIRLKKLQKYYKKKIINSQDVILISGTPRGGTTWVNEVLCNDKKVFNLWEPLHPFSFQDYFGDGNKYWFEKYLPVDSSNKKLSNFFSDLLEGNFITEKLLDRNGKFKSYENCDKFLIKFCRLNEMLPWFVQKFPGYKVLQIDRNPIAVVSSQMKHGAWSLKKENIENFKKLDGDYYCPEFYNQFKKIVEEISYPEEFLAAKYCLSLIPSLNARKSSNVYTVKYEDLFLKPEKEFTEVYRFLGLDVPNDLLSLVKKPSSTTKPGSNITSSPKDQLLTWKRNLNDDQYERIMTVLNKFGFNQISEVDYKLEIDKVFKYF